MTRIMLEVSTPELLRALEVITTLQARIKAGETLSKDDSLYVLEAYAATIREMVPR